MFVECLCSIDFLILYVASAAGAASSGAGTWAVGNHVCRSTVRGPSCCDNHALWCHENEDDDGPTGPTRFNVNGGLLHIAPWGASWSIQRCRASLLLDRSSGCHELCRVWACKESLEQERGGQGSGYRLISRLPRDSRIRNSATKPRGSPAYESIIINPIRWRCKILFFPLFCYVVQAADRLKFHLSIPLDILQTRILPPTCGTLDLVLFSIILSSLSLLCNFLL